MFKILTLNKISPIIRDYLPEDKFSISSDEKDPDAIIVRSFNMHEMELGSNLKAIARAGAGVNNIPVDECTEKGIVVFNSPGANSNAVAELTVFSIFMASRNAFEAMSWAKTLEDGELPVTKQVEKGKGAFVGHEIIGKTLGVIGLGAIGAKVAAKASALGMNVIGFDPFLSPKVAASLPSEVKIVDNENELIASSDIITVHVPLIDATRGKFNADFISECKDGVILINMSRAEIADPDAVKAGIDSGKIAKYVCDFPTSDLLGYKNTVFTPHLASGTYESEDNCAVMAAQEIYDYLINGKIANSVNFPSTPLD